MTSSAHTSAGRRVVVGVDRSLSARVALEHAARRAGEDGSLVVAHAFVPVTDAISGSVSGLDDEYRVTVQERVEQLAADAGVQTDTRIVDGDARRGVGASWRARPAPRRSSSAPVAWAGSRPRSAASHTRCWRMPTVPSSSCPRKPPAHPQDEGGPSGRTVVVGYDGSQPARAALEYAARRAGSDGEVVAVYAYQPTPDWLGAPQYQRALDASQTSGREVLASLEDEQPESGVRLTTSLLEGPPARAIVAAADARDADEIVVGSRGFGRLRGVLGSVSHAVLHEADRPVVVIPAAAS